MGAERKGKVMKVLLKNGSLLDQSEGLVNVKKDILIADGRIAKIAEHIEAADAEVIDCEGKIVSPGFIDIHVHCFPGCPGLGVKADDVGIRQGVTTVVDAGTAGPENFEQFLEEIVKPSKTRVFSALNYSKQGLWVKPEGDDERKWDLELAEQVARKYPDRIVAIKARASDTCVKTLGIRPIQAAKTLAVRCGLPLYVHIGHALPLIEDTLAVMQKDDIITHAFHGKDNNLFDGETLKPQTQAAKERGVLFDVGHGQASFNFNTFKTALKLGFYPDCISTDLHARSFHRPVKSLTETMDKMVALGMELKDVVEDVTSQPAKLLRLKDLGKLKEGYLADFTIYHLKKEETHYEDADGNTLEGNQTIVVDLALIGGVVEFEKQ